ncbi:hypothetical protein QEG73_17525 [Chitinophagaceae bacterium 26-R-25]|nr:hypothetical protein [Chitinophagaceae bacterium 26-R-25]
MNQSKFSFFFFLSLFNVLCAVVIIADFYVIPAKEVKEKFDYLSHKYTRSKSGRESQTSYFVCQSGREYKVPNNFDIQLNNDSSLIIKRTAILRVALSMSSPSNQDVDWSDVGLVKEDGLLLSVMVIWILVSIYGVIRREPIHESGVDIILISALFYLYFTLEIV